MRVGEPGSEKGKSDRSKGKLSHPQVLPSALVAVAGDSTWKFLPEAAGPRTLQTATVPVSSDFPSHRQRVFF